MKWLQKLGKALMLPVACLPICGILMGIGYLLCPATMQGGEITGIIPTIGLFLVKAGGALIDNMAILFAIGVGVGMSDDHDGTAGLAALASWLMMTTLLSEAVVTILRPGVAENATQLLAYQKIQNPFIGIIAGVIGSTCYNRFKNTKLPNWLAFFSGKRCVAMVAGVVSIIVAAVLLFIWPLIFGGLVALGKGIANMGAAAVNQFCQDHGFTSTRLEAPLTADSSEKTNSTSASDCCRLLSEIYNQTLVNSNASSEMLSLLKQQAEKDKILSGLPAETETAGTEGTQSDSVENNMAVVLDSASPYVFCVLSNNIKNSSEAKENTKKISADIYQYMTSESKSPDTPS